MLRRYETIFRLTIAQLKSNHLLIHPSSDHNSLPNTVVEIDTVDKFTLRLDKFWMYQDIKYDLLLNLPESEVDLSVILKIIF